MRKLLAIVSNCLPLIGVILIAYGATVLWSFASASVIIGSLIWIDSMLEDLRHK